MRTRRTFLLSLLIAALMGVAAHAPNAEAGSCKITATQIDFGSFDPLRQFTAQSVGHISYTCSHTVSNVRITLSAGQSNNGSKRRLARIGGGPPLPYSLSLDPSQTQPWGDGFGTTSLYMAASAPAQTDIRVPVYAILYSQEIPTVGTYSDTITLQLSWQ